MRPLLPARIWIGWVALVHLAFAYFAMFRQDLLASGAYTWATDVVSFRHWSLVSSAIVVLIVVSWWRKDVRWAFAALGLALPTQVTFGLSIFVLTFSDPPVVSAVLGAFQWWTLAVGNLVVLLAAATEGLRLEPHE